MKSVLWLPPSFALILILSGCANNNSQVGNDPLGTGPFDSQGRYREDWADDPSKWRKPGGHPQPAAQNDDVPVVAKNEEPPPNSNPLSTEPPKTQKPKTTRKVEEAPKETTTAKHETAKHEGTKHATAKHEAESKTKEEKPTSKPTVAKTKPKPKAKPKATRYVVKQGDTLSGIASRNGSSVSAIQRENGISGTLIHPGQSLVIPKH